MAAYRVDLVDSGTGLQHHVGGINLILKRDPFDRAAHQSRGSSADDHDKQILWAGRVDQIQNFLACTETFFIGERMPAYIHIRVPEYIRRFADLHDGDPAGEIVSENLVNSHRHVVAGFPGAEKVDVTFF